MAASAARLTPAGSRRTSSRVPKGVGGMVREGKLSGGRRFRLFLHHLVPVNSPAGKESQGSGNEVSTVNWNSCPLFRGSR